MRRFISAIAVMMVMMILSSILWSQDSAWSAKKKNSFGFGFGIPYGGLGGNIDINIVKNLHFSCGFGYIGTAGYNFGIIYILAPIKNNLRPRFSANYGVNAIEEGFTGWKAYRGVSLGMGVQRMWGNNGLDFDLIIIAYSDGKVEGKHRVKISFGYRRAF